MEPTAKPCADSASGLFPAAPGPGIVRRRVAQTPRPRHRRVRRRRDGLVIRFDDFDNGADTYEVTIDFAQTLALKKVSPKTENDLELRIKASIDGTDEIWFRPAPGEMDPHRASAPAGSRSMGVRGR